MSLITKNLIQIQQSFEDHHGVPSKYCDVVELNYEDISSNGSLLKDDNTKSIDSLNHYFYIVVDNH